MLKPCHGGRWRKGKKGGGRHVLPCLFQEKRHVCGQGRQACCPQVAVQCLTHVWEVCSVAQGMACLRKDPVPPPPSLPQPWEKKAVQFHACWAEKATHTR